MKINIPKETKKYLKLIEELKEYIFEGYISEQYYPDMSELQESLYDYILDKLGIQKGCYDTILCRYSLEDLETKVKECRKLRKANRINEE